MLQYQRSLVAWLSNHLSTDDWTVALLLFFSVLGAYTCLSYPISFLRVLWAFTPLASPFKVSLSTLAKPRSLGKNAQDRTSVRAWAVVTGPTGGIGKEFSLQLAKYGFNLVLVGRSQSKLDGLIKDIRSIAPPSDVDVKTFVVDFEHASQQDWSKFKSLIERDLAGPVTILINNAGVSHSSPQWFESTPDVEINSITSVNINAVLNVTKCVLPCMMKHRQGLILNLGSFSALVPTPLLATYAGSKGFLYTWTQALGAELEDKGITVRLVNPYFIASEMSKIKRASWLIPSPRTYVKSVLSTLGLAGGAVGKSYISTPYLPHAIAQWIIDHVGSERFWLRYNLKMQKGIALRAERKRLASLSAKGK